MWTLLAALFLPLGGSVSTAASPVAEAPAAYESAWTDLLRRVVTDNGLVRYGLLAGPLRDEFDTVVDAVETFDAASLRGDAAKLAFWMNAYNVKMIERVLDEGVPANIEARGFDAFFKTPVRVAGRDLTLDQIEHGILRRQDASLAALQPSRLDPRIHVGLNCGAVSCPALRHRAFTAANVDAELHRAMHDFVNGRRHFRFDGETAVLSSLLDWFGADFDSTGEKAGDWLLGFLDPDRRDAVRLRTLLEGRSAADLKARDDVRFAYRWDLNAAK